MKELEDQILQIHSNIVTSTNLLQSEKKDLSIPRNELSQKLKSIGEENMKFQQIIVRNSNLIILNQEQPFFKNKFDLDELLLQDLLNFVDNSPHFDIIQQYLDFYSICSELKASLEKSFLKRENQKK
jgi:hypothetical protein